MRRSKSNLWHQKTQMVFAVPNHSRGTSSLSLVPNSGDSRSVAVTSGAVRVPRVGAGGSQEVPRPRSPAPTTPASSRSPQIGWQTPARRPIGSLVPSGSRTKATARQSTSTRPVGRLSQHY
ncbi:hypothetical protein FTUN_0566 [Frigoriglobus tundricola]|uniref:Uncharacterized protein n=1 Tax=Frigoriglobus tundricola TaxID=2774151 RepID=A0A6M5YHR6_9BACT|nr:hypothetical protein FTUN_0566 [Frigoriglobus tundricola]